MHENFGDSGILPQKSILDLVGNPVPLRHGNAPVHQHVQIDIIPKSHFAKEALIQSRHTRNGSRNSPHFSFHIRTRRSIQQFAEGRSHLPYTVK